MTISCPKCKQVYEVEADAIGKECECQCGNTFVAEIKQEPAKQPAVKKVITVTRPAPTAKSAAPSVAIAFRVIAYIMLAGGILTMLAGIEAGSIAAMSGIGGIIASLPLFAISIIIESLAKIAENTSEMARKMSINGKLIE